MQYLVTKDLLALHDKYDGDLGLLDEPWATKGDRDLFTEDQIRTLGEYLEKVRLRKLSTLSPDLRKKVEDRIGELETLIAPDVVSALRTRVK